MSFVDEWLALEANARQLLFQERAAEAEATAIEAFQRMLTAAQVGEFLEALLLNDLLIELNAFRQDSASQIYTYLMRANLLLRGSMGDLYQAWETFRHALELARNHPELYPTVIQTARGLADHSFAIGSLTHARQYCEAALELATSLSPSGDVAYIHSRFAAILSALQDSVMALSHYQYACDLYQQLNDEPDMLEALLNIAYVQMNLRSFNAATSTLRQAEERAVKMKDLPRLTRARILQAQIVFLVDQDFENARRLFLRATETAESAERAFGFLQAANMSLTMHQLEDAQKYFETALDGFRAVNDLKAQAACYAGLADTFEQHPDFVQAKKHLENARACYQQADDLWGEMTVAQQAAALAWEVGELEEALAQYRHALDLAESLNDLDMAASIHNALGTLYENLNLKAEAHAEYAFAAQQYRHLGNKAYEARSFAALAYLELEQWTQCREDAAKALSAARTAHDPTLLAQIHKQVANLYLQQRYFPRALAHTQRALRLHRRLRLPDAIAQDWMDIGELESMRREYEIARVAFLRAARWYRCLKSSSHRVFAEIAAAHADFSNGRTEEARRLLVGALEHYQAATVQNPIAGFAAKVGLGVVSEETGNLASAIRCFQSAITDLESLRGDFALPDLAMGFIGSKAHLYAHTCLLLVRQSRMSEAMDVVQQAKSRAWLGLLAFTTFMLRPRSTDMKIVESERQWLVRARAILGRTHSTQPRGETLNALREAAVHLDHLWEQMEDKEYVALRGGDSLTCRQVIEVIQTREDS